MFSPLLFQLSLVHVCRHGDIRFAAPVRDHATRLAEVEDLVVMSDVIVDADANSEPGSPRPPAAGRARNKQHGASGRAGAASLPDDVFAKLPFRPPIFLIVFRS